MKNRYALLVESAEIKRQNLYYPQQWYVVCEPHKDDYCEAVGEIYREGTPLPANTKRFSSYTKAENFAWEWRGYPWWVQPNGDFRILEVTEVTKTIVKVVGYTCKNAEPIAEVDCGLGPRISVIPFDSKFFFTEYAFSRKELIISKLREMEIFGKMLDNMWREAYGQNLEQRLRKSKSEK